MRKLLLSLVLCLPMAGCVEQKMTITSEPSGAIVRVSDVEVGTTPCTIPWTFAGDYSFILSKPGYQTLNDHANIKPQWYELPPMDLFAQISPGKIEDNRYVHFKLEKLVVPPNQELIKQGLEMRKETNAIK